LECIPIPLVKEKRGKSYHFRFMRRVADDLIPVVRRDWYKRVRLGTDKEVAKRETHRLENHYNQYEAHLRSLPPEKQDELVRLPHMQAFLRYADADRADWAAWDPNKPRSGMSLEMTRRRQLDALLHDPEQDEIRAKVAELEPLAPVALKAEPAEPFTFDGLLTLPKITRCVESTKQNLRRTVTLLKEALGAKTDYRDVDGDAAGKFRDHLATLGGYKFQSARLSQASALFGAAIDARTYKERNPFEGIGPSAKPEDDTNKTKAPYSGAQLRHILDTARTWHSKRNEPFGGERHEHVLWAMRTLTFNGERPNEVLLVQKGSIGVKDGVPVIDISAKCCVTGERLTMKSVKNSGSDRRIPLHPALWDAEYQKAHGLPVESILDFAKHDGTDADKASFLFKCFPWNKTKYRRGWWDSNFSEWVREACGIKPDEADEKQSLTSKRQRFHDAMEHAKIGGKHERILTGHAAPDVHENYKRGKNLKLLAADVARIDVLSD
jgi:hypothetical protein